MATASTDALIAGSGPTGRSQVVVRASRRLWTVRRRTSEREPALPPRIVADQVRQGA